MVSYYNVQYYLLKTITELTMIYKISHCIRFKLQNEIHAQEEKLNKKKRSPSKLKQNIYTIHSTVA